MKTDLGTGCRPDRKCRALRGAQRLAWAAVLGLISGGACVVMRLFFYWLQYLLIRQHGLLPVAAGALPLHVRWMIPVVGAGFAMLVLWIGRRFQKYETYEDYVEAVRLKGGSIPFAPTAWRTLSAAFSIATGAAVGREGSMIQFAAATTSAIGDRFRASKFPLSSQVACGTAAAVAAAYSAPLAGICFASELVLGEWVWPEVPGLAIASVTGWIVSRAVLGQDSLFAVHQALRLADVPWASLLVVTLALLGPLYQAMLKSLAGLRALPLSLLWGGVVVGVLSCRQTMVWGNGDLALKEMLSGNATMAAIASILVFRLIATTVCVGVGTVGGVFTPTLFAGAAAGLAFGAMVHVAQPVLFAVLGVSVFLAAVTHAPWLSGCMTVELTGQWHLLPFLLFASFAAAALSRRVSTRSLYSIGEPYPLCNVALAQT